MKPTPTELLQALNTANPHERELLLEALGAEPEAAPVLDAARQVEQLRQCLPGLSDDYLIPLLMGKGSHARASTTEVTEAVHATLKEHWETALSLLPQALLCCGDWGRKVLGKVRKEIEAEATATEVAEIGYVFVLADGFQKLAMQQGEDASASAVYGLIKEHRAQYGPDASRDVLFDQWTPERLNLLLNCGSWVRHHMPEAFRLDAIDLWREVHKQFTKALERQAQGKPADPRAYEQWKLDQQAARAAARSKVPPTVADDLARAITAARAEHGDNHPLKHVENLPPNQAIQTLAWNWYMKRTGIDPDRSSGFGRGRPL